MGRVKDLEIDKLNRGLTRRQRLNMFHMFNALPTFGELGENMPALLKKEYTRTLYEIIDFTFENMELPKKKSY